LLATLEQFYRYVCERNCHLATVFGPGRWNHPDAGGQVEILPPHGAKGVTASAGQDQHFKKIRP
jgi:hypothetical protein